MRLPCKKNWGKEKEYVEAPLTLNYLEHVIERLRHKLIRLMIVASVPMALPICFVGILIRPWICFRVGPIPVHRIGAVAFNVEFYLAYREVVGPPKGTQDFFFPVGSPANEYFNHLFRKELVIHPLFEILWLSTYCLPSGERHRFNSRDLEAVPGNEDHLGLFAKTSPHLVIPPSDHLVGRQYLKKIGCEDNDQFVCFCMRDSKYLESLPGHRHPQRFQYHQYRDVDIDLYEEAALALAERGYWVFRMGKIVEKPFKVNHPKVVDYATSMDRCDFLDVWLMANCFFCVSTGLGIDAVAELFRKPLCVVDFLPLSNIKFGQWGITTPKRLVWRSTGKTLTIPEYLDHGYRDSGLYEKNGIEISNLSSQELTEAVLTMDDSLIGENRECESDIKLQERFWTNFKDRSSRGPPLLPGWEVGQSIEIHPKAKLSLPFLRRLTGFD